MDFFSGFIAGAFIYAFYSSSLKRWWGRAPSHQHKNHPHKHHPPAYHGYRGGWANVCVCSCGSVSLREDNHPIDPCRDCGFKVDRPERSAKWTSNGWVFAGDSIAESEGY